MVLLSVRKFQLFLVSVFSITAFISVLPARAASALAAWKINSDGVLQLRTSVNAKLRAFYQESSNGKGDRVWIDFSGELIRPRTIPGNGPIKEIRLGKPSKGRTRLVVEFMPSIELNPERLKLVGVSSDRWELKLFGVPTLGYKVIGEGDVFKSVQKKILKVQNNKDISQILSYSSLPSFPRNRFSVVIDPGHGGPDPGAVGIGGLRETEVVLDVSKRISKYLSAQGVKVILTRTRDIDLDLPPRVNKANRLRANAFVSIHANASRGHRRDINGLETYYYAGYQGYKLASKIHKEILYSSPGSIDRGVRRARFFVIRRTNMPAALVEIGFVTGRFDARKLKQNEYREKIAFGITRGILNYLKEAS